MALQQSKSIKNLIKDWAFAIGNKNYSPARDPWMFEVWNEVRDEIEEKGLSENEEVKKLDQKLIKDTIKYFAYSHKDEKPLKKWWWHLDKIAKKEYPAELLPDHLRDIYEKWKKNT